MIKQMIDTNMTLYVFSLIFLFLFAQSYGNLENETKSNLELNDETNQLNESPKYGYTGVPLESESPDLPPSSTLPSSLSPSSSSSSPSSPPPPLLPPWQHQQHFRMNPWTQVSFQSSRNVHIGNPMLEAINRNRILDHGMPYGQRGVPLSAQLPLPVIPKAAPCQFDCASLGSIPHSKRELENPSISLHNFETFYLNPKNHDIMFSICGNLFPAHRILVEAVSKQFEHFTTLAKENVGDNPILIESIDDLMEEKPIFKMNIKEETTMATTEASNRSSIKVIQSSICPNDRLVNAFKIFLKYFYYRTVSLDEINQLKTSFYLWELSKKFLAFDQTVNDIEMKITQLIDLNNLDEVYRFVRKNRIDSIKSKWSEFIHAHTNELFSGGKLEYSCEKIKDDIEFFDQFMASMNINQSSVIKIVSQFIQKCPLLKSIPKITASGHNLFPNSFQFYRCTIDDLKELVKMGFITYEHLAEELENRLRSLERQMYEKQTMGGMRVENKVPKRSIFQRS